MLRTLHCLDSRLKDVSNVVGLTPLPPCSSAETLFFFLCYTFLLEAELNPGPIASRINEVN
jgi:hypothetical protein